MEILVEMITTRIVKVDAIKLTHKNYWDVIKKAAIEQYGDCDEIMFDWQSFENKSRPTPTALDPATPRETAAPNANNLSNQHAPQAETPGK
jgi:hypothetical protein